MRKFLIFVAAGLLLIAVKVYSNGLRPFYTYGEYSYFTERDEEIKSDRFRLIKGYDKLLVSGMDAANKIISELNAREVFSEKLDGVTVRYYYSPYMGRSVTVKNKKVSLMVAEKSDGSAVLGAPLIKGCY